MTNVAAYNKLAANWSTATASGFAGEVHVLLDTYGFSATHVAADLAAFDLTAPSGAGTAQLALATIGDFSAGPFTVNPISLVIPAHAGSYRYLAWCMPTSHDPLLWIDLGSSFSDVAGDTAVITFTGTFLGVTV